MPRIRTGYSFRVAVGKIEDVIERLLVCNYSKAPITDRASTFGFVKWDKLCKKKNIEPVFGVEIGVTSSPNAKKISADYWTFIAIDSIIPVNKILELATTQFRYEPLLTYTQAMQAQGLFKIIGHRSDLNEIQPQENTFIGLSPSTSKGYINEAIKKGFQFIAISDNKYCNSTEDDKKLYEIICGKGASTQSYDQYIQNPDQWMKSVKDKTSDEIIKSAVLNFEKVLGASNAKLVKGELLKPEKPKPLLEMCIEGAKKIGVDLSNPVYDERLKRELGLISEKKFEDYFYIITDMVQWARARMLVGPARGSSCGSLVCYLLEITTVDPIPFGLIFERFISTDRDDLPDIDIDFSDTKRHLVFEYLVQKYGADRVAKLGTVNTYAGPGALNEAGVALQIPKWKFSSVSENLLKKAEGDARALDTLADTFATVKSGQALINEFPEIGIVTRMEGHPRHFSQHAAGIILTEDSVSNYVAVDRRTGATHCDKKDAEILNLLKVDVLGLTQLSIFEYALELAGLDRLTLEKIPLDDPTAFKVLNDKKFSGIFQFGASLQSISNQFNVETLNDIVSITSLARPGALASGGAHEWVKRKNKVKDITYYHEMFESYLKDTLGVITYQEQVMEICRHIGDFSWSEVTEIRKAISKSLGKEHLNKWEELFKTNAIKKGGNPLLMQKAWDDICTYGSYGFNKSHAVAYGLISYQCLWLKAHYPFEFAAATLSFQESPDMKLNLLREIVDEGYEYLPVDADISTDKWTVGHKDGKKILIGSLNDVKGIGPKTISSILSARARGEKIPSKAEKLLKNAKTDIDSLSPIKDAFKKLLPNPSEMNIHTPPTRIKDIRISSEDYDVVLFCVFSKISPRDENDPEKVKKRGRKVGESESTSLMLKMTDDTDTVLGKISGLDYENIGKPIVDRGKPGRFLYAVKGTVWGNGSFKMVMVKKVKYIGDIKETK